MSTSAAMASQNTPSITNKDDSIEQPLEPIAVADPPAEIESRSRLRITGILLALFVSDFIHPPVSVRRYRS